MSRMFKALLKKQLMEVMLSFTGGAKKNGRKSMIGYSILLLTAFLSFCFMFGMAADTIYGNLHSTGLDWLYYSLMGLMALMISVMGSAFATYSAIYKAKDNETLLSMPVPQWLILLTRMCGCYLTALIFCALVLIPALVVSCLEGSAGILTIILMLLAILLLSLISLALSCLLGWVIALIAPHVRHKSLVTTVISFALIAGYYVFYMRITEILQSFVEYADETEKAIKSYVYPFYMLGRGLTGEIVPFLIFAAISAAVFAVVYYLMSRSFIKLATASEKTAKNVYREKKAKLSSPSSALLRREMKHYISSAAYILNCSMGTIFMIILTVFAIIQSGRLKGVIEDIAGDAPGFVGIVPLIIGAATAILIAYNLMTVPSISLEGKSLWLIRSLPVTTAEILKSKLDFHLLMTLPFSAVCAIVLFIVTGSDIKCSAAVILFITAFNVASASLGMILALKRPNLNYADEASAIKQNWSVTVRMFGGMIITGLLAVLYFIVHSFIAPWLFALAAAALFAGLSALMLRWIYSKGIEIFESL
ncbi:MAG: hypothetical protein IJT56_00325 [Clostridia bacterium]|nr:hypothetical protein [Clostridia bacterium]